MRTLVERVGLFQVCNYTIYDIITLIRLAWAGYALQAAIDCIKQHTNKDNILGRITRETDTETDVDTTMKTETEKDVETEKERGNVEKIW